MTGVQTCALPIWYLLDEEVSYGIPDIFGPREVMKLKAFEEIEVLLWEVFETEPPE